MDMTCDPPLARSAPDASIDHSHSIAYWTSVPSTDDGMLGGYPGVSRKDLVSSHAFLTKLRRGKTPGIKRDLPKLNRVADCGAGIGRITKGFLMDVAVKVDIVEPVKKFTDELVAGLGPEEKGKMGEVFNLGLQDWTPKPGAYNLIWNQWCLGHLTDEQLVAYLRRCKDGLAKPSEEGESDDIWIVVKENMSPNKDDIYDEEDSSVTRTDTKFRKLFKEAGLKLVAEQVQKGFPSELFPVRMYALKSE
ncbi:alpha-N-methyltransferase NTM1 [Clohesyomyces aquaticus]|uniref:Alpha N-terminal protein methyltransferase 1 n=1 Tax=Clohesyomyces aquaticus TaxID=1231657 RepID=A0A1Y2AAT6_9PLEO|nr:alpha-N-methyltransferase NTM1 [Clohesyomyces aquaticus]